MNYEQLLTAADQEGLCVKEQPLTGHDGLIRGSRIAIRKDIETQVRKPGIVYAKEVPMIKVKQVKEINGKGTPLQTVIQYWTKDGILVAEGRINQFDEPEMNDTAS